MSWAAAALVFQVVASTVQAAKQTEAAQAQANAQAQSSALAIAEADRQQAETNRAANEQKSDRMRQAEADIARARVASAEGFGSLTREVAELGYLEGVDLSRIEANRAGQVNALQSRKNAAALGASVAQDNANRTADAAPTSVLLNSIGAGVQIGARQEYYDQAVERAKNKSGEPRPYPYQ